MGCIASFHAWSFDDDGSNADRRRRRKNKIRKRTFFFLPLIVTHTLTQFRRVKRNWTVNGCTNDYYTYRGLETRGGCEYIRQGTATTAAAAAGRMMMIESSL